MMLTGRFVEAGEALRIGLVTDVVADDKLLTTALIKAEAIIGHPAFAVSLTKEGMWAALETPGLHAGHGSRGSPTGPRTHKHRSSGRRASIPVT
jgi:enoyl-CoA hydratase